MIVLDEQLADPRIIQSIENWYKGKVTTVEQARPHTRITDDVIPVLLRPVEGTNLRNYQSRGFLAKDPSRFRLLCDLPEADI